MNFSNAKIGDKLTLRKEKQWIVKIECSGSVCRMAPDGLMRTKIHSKSFQKTNVSGSRNSYLKTIVHLVCTNYKSLQSISVTKLRANMLKVIAKVKRGKRITITSRRQPVAELVPPTHQKNDARMKLKQLSKTAVVIDVTSPIDESWSI